jgi:hypothetical protein
MAIPSIEIIGLLGSFILLTAWIYEMYRTLKKGDQLDVNFIIIYIIGLIFLVYYSLVIESLSYIILNGAILILSFVELDIAFRRRAKRKP